ncbi:MAG: type 2 isopentenyl-diphosphate Delta-isomerase [Porticoccaceae bacterium]
MKSDTKIQSRKDEHLDLALQRRHQSKDSSAIDAVLFEHNALPELAITDVDTSTNFLQKTLSAPIIIGAMTGGTSQGESINRHLAEAAEACNIPLAVGSQRASLSNSLSADLRRFAPNGLLLGNLGGTQLQQGGIDLARRAIDAIEADGLFIHLNPLQELIQPSGDRNWRMVLEAIGDIASRLETPVLVKEVGAGLSPNVVSELLKAGVSAVDLAGRGGTNWASIELARNKTRLEQEIATPFLNWGMDTIQLLPRVRDLHPDSTLIASGGIRNGLDAARFIRLGASMVSLAHYFLSAATISTEAVVERIYVLNEQLRWTMFLTGSSDLSTFRKAPLLSPSPNW